MGVSVGQEKPKMFAKGTEITVGLVVKKLNEILQARGKKGTDRWGCPIDPPELWQKCLGCIEELLELLFAHPEIFVGENVLEESENLSNPEQDVRVRGCTCGPQVSPGAPRCAQVTAGAVAEYVEHLKDEGRVCAIIARLQRYLQGKGSPEELCRVYLRRVLHTYYKFDYGAARRKGGAGQVKEEGQEKEEEEEEEDSEALMERLCRFVYAKDRTDRIRTCAILCHIYHHALHSRWYRARDLMLMSHLQDNIQHADPPVQILYNRTMVQLGICAFRQGLIKDAHNALLDIQSSGRAKELLGQGLLLRSLQERNAEQEKVEKRRQVPFHMHVNLELLECVYLVAAMLLEIPYMAAHEFDARRRMISKQFHHQLRVGERQPLLGPPESMREHVVAASKAMKTGDWRRCHRFVVNDKMNGKVWDLFPEAEQVRAMLVR
ncbi:PREDICTED: eukaryotic translation initiation factor 3 subunit C-like [Pseudopodoces humilis]|uniref:eukaryotic translation initiation factor 3 subunit C-like n=1 Tax=Pseudopodoces humilis TaxID=181119 RepID=UPI0003955753|nr:PREDICTED: eukaryotic translation initiation factor 3 subunit C-like [Pseudopodoces humilis]